ncbi:type IV toxin-antitoxin system AbiEi family antitoxin [Flexistipes sinusarabici]|uniref:type IV toxin-antitoxin system AbiEi family antitoxin n=1 Tax=Flexistipes sinusarabici TaxID=2352 RepID=UPI0023557D49|nr:type IV toxin-antitoxin system AbiEi family antitoxin [Flexistipes sinusarabici]
MSLQNSSKINLILQKWPSGTIALTRWFNANGISSQLLNKYKESGWIESVGTGAFKKANEEIDYTGAVYAMQNQLGLSIHPGGKTAFAMQGKAHYLELKTKYSYLYRHKDEKIPAWFRNQKWNIVIKHFSSNFLPKDLELIDHKVNNYEIKISSPARAILECLLHASTAEDILVCYQLTEGLNNLNPDKVNKLLKSCSSVKVKRLFLFMADEIGHAWFKYINLNDIDLGKGKRSFGKNGTYIDKYKITIPKNVKEYHGS